MKRRSYKMIAVLLSILIFVFSTVNTVYGASLAQSKEELDSSRKGSVELTYADSDKLYSGLEIEIYFVASISADLKYDLTDDFAEHKIGVNGITAQSEWDDVCNTVSMYISYDKIKPIAEKITDENGMVKFEDLSLGLYYVRWTGNNTEDNVSGFVPFLISVPNLDDDGKWIYDVCAFPKKSSEEPEHFDKLTVTKEWRGSSVNNRPTQIDVYIYKDGELFEKIVLSNENNWTYTWETTGDHEWAVIENGVPDGYTVNVTESDGKFIIINTSNDNPPPPFTGDSFNIFIWLAVMVISGMVLVFIGTRRRHSDA